MDTIDRLIKYVTLVRIVIVRSDIVVVSTLAVVAFC